MNLGMFIPVAMRIAIIFSKLFLLSLAAKIGGLEIVGEFGVVLAIIGFIPTVAGLELYQRINRKTSVTNKQSYGSTYQINILLALAVSLFLAAFCVAVYFNSYSKLLQTLLILSILVEVVYLDLNRFEFACRNYRRATFNNFYKSVFPILIIIPLIYHLEIGFLKAFIYADLGVKLLIVIATWRYYSRGRYVTVNRLYQILRKGYLKRALYSARYFIVTSLSNNLLEYSDRLFISFFISPTQMGVYIIAVSIVNSVKSLTFYGPISRYYPELVRFSKQRDFSKVFLYAVVALSITIVIVTLSIIGVQMLTYTGWVNFLNSISETGSYEFLIFGIATLCLVQSMSYIPHYILFGAQKDKENALINTLVLVVFTLGFYTVSIENAYGVLFLKTFALLLGSGLKLWTFTRWREDGY